MSQKNNNPIRVDWAKIAQNDLITRTETGREVAERIEATIEGYNTLRRTLNYAETLRAINHIMQEGRTTTYIRVRKLIAQGKIHLESADFVPSEKKSRIEKQK